MYERRLSGGWGEEDPSGLSKTKMQKTGVMSLGCEGVLVFGVGISIDGSEGNG